MPLVTQVFNEKTIAAFCALKDTVKFSEGTVVFIQMVVDCFKMSSVKDKYAAVRHRDKLRSPWKLDCKSFGKLRSIVEVVSTCKHSGGRKRVKKLTSYTADAFKVTTEYNIEAAIYLLEKYSFSYILSAIFSQDPLEKFFGQARQRCGGNFYIDIVDVLAVAKMQILHQLLKHDLLPDACHSLKCPSCTEEVNPDDVDIVRTLTIADTQKLFDSEDQMKHKVIYCGIHSEESQANR